MRLNVVIRSRKARIGVPLLFPINRCGLSSRREGHRAALGLRRRNADGFEEIRLARAAYNVQNDGDTPIGFETPVFENQRLAVFFLDVLFAVRKTGATEKMRFITIA
ncbi:hypothetical protein [Pararhizobium antarcticum]|uniref:hypothetical protein n=1 Tax=Pararhizobium antarcticum TaxID=1798805 RepID=UPI00111485E8|nr:hypothetical protein [Pararhizobium antarcticum]